MSHLEGLPVGMAEVSNSHNPALDAFVEGSIWVCLEMDFRKKPHMEGFWNIQSSFTF